MRRAVLGGVAPWLATYGGATPAAVTDATRVRVERRAGLVAACTVSRPAAFWNEGVVTGVAVARLVEGLPPLHDQRRCSPSALRASNPSPPPRIWASRCSPTHHASPHRYPECTAV